MKNINLGIAQTKSEYFFMKEYLKEKKNLAWLPLNLEMFLYYKINKISYINPNNLFKSKDHKILNILIENNLKKINFHKIKSSALKERAKGIFRKYINSIMFFITIVENIKKKNKIDNFFVSGWDSFNFKSKKNNFFISSICSDIYENTETLKKGYLENTPVSNYTYFLKNKISFFKNYVILNNLGYNFTRFIVPFFKKKIKILVIEKHSINFIKTFLFKLVGVNFVILKKKFYKKESKITLPLIHYKYKKFDLSKLLNIRKDKIEIEINDLIEKFKPLKKFINKNNPLMLLSNHSRGLSGMICENLHEKKIPTILISHGTLSKGDKISDKNYQKIIAGELVNSSTEYLCSQTKITKYSLKTIEFKKKNVDVGNIIFNNKKYITKKSNILYAVTARDFVNMQFHGIETYFEIFTNLEYLNKIQKKIDSDILVNLHPNIRHLKKDFIKLFKNIKFYSTKIDNLLSRSSILISYSSTVIEEAICSKIPVILFDQWNRYIHCKSEKNYKKKNRPVYYLNNKKNLLTTINTILSSDNILFNDYIIDGSPKQNIKKLINKFI